MDFLGFWIGKGSVCKAPLEGTKERSKPHSKQNIARRRTMLLPKMKVAFAFIPNEPCEKTLNKNRH